MKAFFTLVLATLAFTGQSQLVVQSTNDFSFTPASETIELGETVTFIISGIHTATQVSEETWLADGNTPLSGGFDFSAGTHEYMPVEIGTIYFVCQPRAGMGMKGMIMVENTTGISDRPSAGSLRIYPNPVADELNI